MLWADAKFPLLPERVEGRRSKGAIGFRTGVVGLGSGEKMRGPINGAERVAFAEDFKFVTTIPPGLRR